MRAHILIAFLVVIPWAFSATFCIPRPSMVYTHIRYQLPETNTYKDFYCSGALCCGEYSSDTNSNVLITIEGEHRPVEYPLYVQVLEQGELARSVVGYGDYYAVTYTNSGDETLRVEENYPKSMVESAAKFSGNLLFLNVDPVVVIYVPPGVNRSITYKVYEKNPPIIIPYIELATCSIRVVDMKYTREGDGILISFRVLEHGRPVYLTSMSVLIDDKGFRPQYDAANGTYTLFAHLDPGTHRLLLRGEAAGCPALVYTYDIDVHAGISYMSYVYVFIILILVVLIVLFARRRRR